MPGTRMTPGEYQQRSEQGARISGWLERKAAREEELRHRRATETWQAEQQRIANRNQLIGAGLNVVGAVGGGLASGGLNALLSSALAAPKVAQDVAGAIPPPVSGPAWTPDQAEMIKNLGTGTGGPAQEASKGIVGGVDLGTYEGGLGAAPRPAPSAFDPTLAAMRAAETVTPPDQEYRDVMGGLEKTGTAMPPPPGTDQEYQDVLKALGTTGTPQATAGQTQGYFDEQRARLKKLLEELDRQSRGNDYSMVDRGY